MKGFFKKGKKSKEAPSASGSNQIPGASYNVKEKNLPKILKFAWEGNHEGIKSSKDDVNTLDSEKRSALHLACDRGHDKVVDSLLTRNADLSVRDKEGHTPIYRAVKSNHHACAKRLLVAGAELEESVLDIAVNAGNADLLKDLLESWDSADLSDIIDKKLLRASIEKGSSEIMAVLLPKCGKVNFADDSGVTALMMASEAGQLELVQLLLRYNADPRATDSQGHNCVDLAHRKNHHDCIKVLESQQQLEAITPRSRASDYDDDESRSTDYDIPVQGNQNLETRELRGRSTINLNSAANYRARSADAAQTLKVPTVRDKRPRSRSQSPMISPLPSPRHSIDEGEIMRQQQQQLLLQQKLQRTELGSKNIRSNALPTVQEASKTPAKQQQQQQQQQQKLDAKDGSDDDSEWSNSQSASVKEKQPKKLNLKQAMQHRSPVAAKGLNDAVQKFSDDDDDDDDDDDTVASDFPAATPRSGGKATPRERNSSLQRQESDWDASEISDVELPPATKPSTAAASATTAKAAAAAAAVDDDIDDDWDDTESEAVPVNAAAAAAAAAGKKRVSIRDAELNAEDETSAWDSSIEESASKATAPPDSARQQQSGDAKNLQTIDEEKSRPANQGERWDSDEEDTTVATAAVNAGTIELDDSNEGHLQISIESQKVIDGLNMDMEASADSVDAAAAAAAAAADITTENSVSDGSPPPQPHQLQRLRDELDEAKEELQQLRQQSAETKEQLVQKQEQLLEVQQRLSDTGEELQDERKRMLALKEEVRLLKEQLELQRTATEETESRSRQLETDLADANNRLNSSNQLEQDLKQQLQQLSDDKEELQMKLKALAEEAEARRSRMDKEEDGEGEGDEKEVALEEVKRLRAANEQLANDNVELNASVQFWQKKSASQDERWQSEQDQLQSAATEDKETQAAALQKLALSVEALKAEKQQLQSKLKEALDEASGQRHEAERLRSEVSQSASNATRAEQQWAEWSEQSQLKDNQLQELRETKVRLEEKLRAAEGRAADLQAEANSQRASAGEHSSETAQLRQELAQVKSELGDARDDVQKLQEQKAALAAGKATAEAQLAAMETANADMRAQLQSLADSMRRGEDKDSLALDRLCHIIANYRSDFDKSRTELEKENLVLQHEVNGLRSSSREAASDAERRAAAAAAANADANEVQQQQQQQMPNWRANEYEDRIRSQEVKNAKLEMTIDFEQRRGRQLKKELDGVSETEANDLERRCIQLTTERDRLSADHQHLQQMYEQERRLRQKLSDELQRLNNSEAAAAAALNLEKERNRLYSASHSFLSSQSALPYFVQQQQQQQQQQQHPILATDAMLQQRLRSELDRSISKHLESDDTARHLSKTRSNGNLHKVSAEMDLSYLDYLKKKFLV